MTEQLRVEYRKIETLIPFARNPRTHSEAQIAKLASSIVEFGWTQPILVDGSNGIIAGHGRLAAARKLDLLEVPVSELGHLSPAQKRAYVIADNRLALDAGWDEELLSLELAELSEAGYDLTMTGFSNEEIEELLVGVEQALQDESSDEPENDAADEVPEVPSNPVSRPGDIWQIGAHRVICGDATDPAVVRTLMAAQRTGRQVRAAEIAPEYVDVTVKRFQQNFPEVPVTLAATGQTFDAVARERLGGQA